MTTFRIDAGMDTGPELVRMDLPIDPDETAGELETRLAALGADAILATLAGLVDGRVVAHPQPAVGISRAPLLSREDGRVDWSRPAAEIHNLIRGTNPWPGAWALLGTERVKLHRAARTELAVGCLEPGEIGPRASGCLYVACADELLELTEVQRECRPRADGRAFLNGLQTEDRFK